MTRLTASSNWFGLSVVIYVLASLWSLAPLLAASAPASDESIDQVYEKAKQEGGKVTVYAPFSNRSMEVILPGFMKRFPGVTVNHVDGTPNQLLARVIAEARGGRVLADVFGGSLPYMAQITAQKLVTPFTVPEAAAYPAQLKSAFWVATDTQYYVLGWNTNLVKKGEAPTNFEDLVNARWKKNLMAENRDYQMLIAFAKRKYNSDEKAIDLFKGIAANQVEFHRGHSDLIEFLVAGQQSVCFTCYAHHFPPRVKKGAPIQSLLNEGVGEIGGAVSILKDAQHPIGALLWTRWALSEEGQRVWAQAGETPAHPHVEPLEKVRPTTTYMLNIDDLKEFPRYEKIWKDIFQIR
jgi:iron(III) transport system substrate-binding protein